MFTSTTPYHRALGSGLTLKSLADSQDAERLITFNGQIFGEGVIGMTRSMIFHHPTIRPEYWLYIEDDATQQIVSSLVLIPWTWRYEDSTLKAAEMGIVGTLESYRNRGLIRSLVGRFKEMLREGEFDLSQIQGIPYFYRQFDYEYAMPLDAKWCLELYEVPDAQTANFTARVATADDIPTLSRLYDEAAAQLNISAQRSGDVWRYLLENTAGTDMAGEAWLIHNANGEAAGYWRVAEHGFGNGLIIGEASRFSDDAASAALTKLKALAIERNKPNLQFNLPTNSDLVRNARYHGAHDKGAYAWQIHLVDPARILRKIAPSLERRLAASPFSGLTRTVKINLYRATLDLTFAAGKLLNANAIGASEYGDINMPPFAFTQLLLGHRDQVELRYSYPDVGISAQIQPLVDVLFPKLESFFFTNY